MLAPGKEAVAGNARSRYAPWVALLAVLLLALALRLPGLSRPLLGHFATKHVVYAMIARNLARGDAPWMYPTLDCLVGGQPAWHLTEFPVAAYAAAGLWSTVGSVLGGSLDFWGRFTSVLCSLVSVWAIWWLVRRWHGPAAALAAALAMAVAPVSVVYGQGFMLESSVVMLTLLAWMGCELVADSAGRRSATVAALALVTVSTALLALTKIYMLVLWPVLVWHVWRTMRQANRAWPMTALVAGCLLVSMLPALAWYGHVYLQTAPGGAAVARSFYSVRDSVAAHAIPHPVLGDVGFYTHLTKDLGTAVLTPIGCLLLACGLFHPAARRHAPWLLAMGLLIVLLPMKFLKMQYYWLVILPPLAVIIGLGWLQISGRGQWTRWRLAGLLSLVVGMSIRWTIGPAWTTPAEDRGVLPAAIALQQHAAPSDRVVTIHGSTIDLLYYCQRQGWALAVDDPQFATRFEEARRQGATWLVVVDANAKTDDTAERPWQSFPLVASGADWQIRQLSPVVTQQPTTLPPR